MLQEIERVPLHVGVEHRELMKDGHEHEISGTDQARR